MNLAPSGLTEGSTVGSGGQLLGQQGFPRAGGTGSCPDGSEETELAFADWKQSHFSFPVRQTQHLLWATCSCARPLQWWASFKNLELIGCCFTHWTKYQWTLFLNLKIVYSIMLRCCYRGALVVCYNCAMTFIPSTQLTLSSLVTIIGGKFSTAALPRTFLNIFSTVVGLFS